MTEEAVAAFFREIEADDEIKELIDFAEQYAKQHGAKNLFLVASNINRKAQVLYESLGFK